MTPKPFQLLTVEEAEYFKRHRRAWLEACRRSPTLFLAHVLGTGGIPGRMHVELQGFLAKGGDRNTFVPRNHGKTTQNSVGLTAFRIGRNPNLRVQIVQATKPDAKKTVRSIKRILESDRYREVFPWVEPDKEQWGVESLCVKRTRLGLRDPTVSAQPINGTAGQRADELVPDDIENFDNSIRSAANRENVKEAWANTWVPTVEPDGEDGPGVIRGSATPWHPAGITMDWLRTAERGKPKGGSLEDSTTLPTFFRKCRGTEESPWPERWTPEGLRRQLDRMGSRAAYERAYELKCVTSEDCIFSEADLLAAAGPLPDRKNLPGSVRFATTDFAFSADDLGLKGPRKSKRDYATLLVGDVARGGHVFAVYAYKGRPTYPRFKDLVVGTCVRLGVQRFRGESTPAQEPLVQDLQRALAEVGISTKRRIRDRDKPSRAAGVAEIVESQKFHVRTNPDGEVVNDEKWGGCMRSLLDEMAAFPLGDHDDLVDVAVDLMNEADPQAVFEQERRVRNPYAVDDIEAEDEEAERAEDEPRWLGDDDDE